MIDPSPLLPKHYDLFGLLFGVSNFANFQPLFAGRGLPHDCDEALRGRYEADPSTYFGASWVFHRELASIDWDVEAEALDERIHEFAIEPDGTERYLGKRLSDSLSEDIQEEIERNGEVRRANVAYRRRRLTRRDAKLGTEFDLLLRLMRALAERFGEDNVRLVVFFD